MPPSKNPIPVYKKHPTKNEARAWVNGRWVSLGLWDTDESRRKYERLCAELRAAVGGAAAHGVTVGEVLAAFARHAIGYYRREDGTLTSEVREYGRALLPVREFYTDLPAEEFGPAALKACRRWMIDAGWCRNLVNRRVGRIKRVFKWATGEELVPVAVHTALATIDGLKKGRTDARESEPVKPVAAAVIARTLPFLNRQVRGLVQFQELTGCRPGEACALRRCDIDMTRDVWVYRPDQHKTAYLDRVRVVMIGPQARSLLAEYPTAADTDFVFSPRGAVAELHAARAAARKTPRYPSHMRRNVEKRKPGAGHAAGYSTTAYDRAIRRAAKKANVPHWWPNQIRHTSGTDVRRRFGLESAGAWLGHSKMSATEVYAERDEDLARKVASEVG